MDYKQKLIDWNSTDKYRLELKFLNGLLCPLWDMKVLDYGCGTGAAMRYIDSRNDFSIINGYDVNDFLSEWSYTVRDSKLEHKYNHVYLMHSIAHFKNQSEELEKIKSVLLENGIVTVITPNAEWLDKDYIGDETVIKHFTQQELCQLFIDSGYTIQLVGQFGEYKNGLNERLFLHATE